jgi:NAD+ diphosphatase
MSFAYAQSPLNRRADLRGNVTELAIHHGLPTSKCVHVAGDAVRMAQGSLDVAMPAATKEIVFLGLDQQGHAWFATQDNPGDSHVSLRTLMIEGSLPAAELSILAQARSLILWHAAHGFCAQCGKPTSMQDAGYRRQCQGCGASHFPRTDPVVIMAVCKDNKTLLGRQAAWPEGMYSTLAGFVEPGETLEQAAHREVMEEVGVRLSAVSYVASQPWPFPASLMVGLIAEAETETLTIDTSEIEAAQWFEAAELKQMLDHTHPKGWHCSRPDAIAWHLAQAALKKISGSFASPQ